MLLGISKCLFYILHYVNPIYLEKFMFCIQLEKGILIFGKSDTAKRLQRDELVSQ